MHLVTGGAGFIGSNLVDALLERGYRVRVVDDLSGGRPENLEEHEKNPRFSFLHGSLLDHSLLENALEGVDTVWHLAAKPDVRSYDIADWQRDVWGGALLLAACAQNGVNKIAFTSSSTVYGEAKMPTPEETPSSPISIYGASKVAIEALLCSHAGMHGAQVWIFRLANIIGKRGSHGVIFDFIKKLRENPKELEILGDGRQSKSYLLVEDCISAMLTAMEKAKDRVNIFNVGNIDRISVAQIAQIVASQMGMNPKFKFTGSSRGWPGDVVKMQLDITKICSLGWRPSANSSEAIASAARKLLGKE